ncbi:MAG TPA: methylated-DNA--[protein]-cysteine S-methyltransferase [Thermoanaerobaculia bacterium]|nr:methylated-DNA--[protein]-cysteine S-methyltransferase [Thermoanaerobaculia bacterium]
MIVFGIVPAPFGELLVAKEDGAVVEIHFRPRDVDGVRDDDAVADVAAQLHEYFRGERQSFDLELAPRGTDFQQLCWSALQRIPYGETRSYSDIAREIGRPAAVRAVGAANGANPIPIVIPCHRVVGSNGALTGFGGGIETKRWLLALESPTLFSVPPPARSSS